MTYDTPPPYATVTLRDVNNDDSIPERTIVLYAPGYEAKIGRGTLSGADDLRPASENAWFDSRVMSRNHAKLSADPSTKEIYIEDVGSMHGTYLSGRRLKVKTPWILLPGEIITMGADVTRGSNYFNALQVEMNWHWSDESSAPSRKLPLPSFETMPGNTFSSDYNEAEHYEAANSEIYHNGSDDGTNYEEDEAETGGEDHFIQDEVCQESIEIVIPQSRTFAVPESDVSDPGSYSSEEENSDADSPTSSPVALSEETVDKDTLISGAPTLEVEKAHPSSSLNQPSPTPCPAGSTSGEQAPGNTSWLPDISDDDVEEEQEGEEGDDDDDDDIVDQGDHGNHVIVTISAADTEHDQPVLPERLESSSSLPQTFVTLSEQPEAIHTSCLSDAAVAKASAEPLHAPPFIQDPRQDSGTDNTPSDDGRSSYAWAGHNSVLYEPVPGNSSQGAVGAPSFVSTTPVVPPSLLWPHNLKDDVWLPQYSSEPQDQLCKVSITTDQVGQSSKESSVELHNPILKRKAEHISSDASFQDKTALPASDPLNVAESVPALASENSTGDAIDVESKLQPSWEPGTEAGEPAPVQNPELPPRKKIKSSNQTPIERRGSTSGSFIKLAAATIAGMAIGTVGTIVGLASLPPDYFI